MKMLLLILMIIQLLLLLLILMILELLQLLLLFRPLLLLLDGRVVLDGAAERFGSAFLTQGAPRTVIGSDGQRLWLLTLQGVEDEGPTLAETAVLLQRLGLRDALNPKLR